MGWRYEMETQEFYLLNGVNRRTGGPCQRVYPGLAAPQVAMWVPRDVDINDLSRAGWGIVFAKKGEGIAGIRQALAPLIAKRREEAHGKAMELDYVPGMDLDSFRRYHRELLEKMERHELPHYLLLVGGPSAIPFSFQSTLASSHAVGRVHFESPDQYALYAQTVIREERSGSRPRRVLFWGADHPDDLASQLTTNVLTRPLAQEIKKASNGYQVEEYFSSAATKSVLHTALGQSAPAFLFTSGHGLFFPAGDQDQREEQGALICGDWPGPTARLPRSDDFYCAADLSTETSPQGLVSFHFACNSAGTPVQDDYFYIPDSETDAPGAPINTRQRMAEEPFVSALSQGLMGHHGGGSLAFIGHLDRTWTSTFFWRGTNNRPTIYIELVRSLLKGDRIGAALDAMAMKTAELSAGLVEQILRNGTFDPRLRSDHPLGQIADLRSFVVLGDPAVRLSTLGSSSNY
jgi:hypothetical protein